MPDEELVITWVVEKTESWDEKLPVIEMMMAAAMARKLGTAEIDMKLDKETCESEEDIANCGMWSVAHHHLTGSVR